MLAPWIAAGETIVGEAPFEEFESKIKPLLKGWRSTRSGSACKGGS